MKTTKRQYALYLFNVLIGVLGSMLLTRPQAWLAVALILVVIGICLKTSMRGPVTRGGFYTDPRKIRQLRKGR